MSASPVLHRCTRLLLFCVILSCDRQSALEPRPDLAEPAHDVTAAVTQPLVPDSAYRASTRLISLASIPNGGFVSGVSDGWINVVSVTPMQKTDYATNGGFWGCPPESETCTPGALVIGEPGITLNLSRQAARFGVEIQPLVAGAHNYTATFYLGGSLLGTVARTGVVNGVARLLAGVSDALFDRVVITGSAPFAIANIRYQTPNPTITLTPAAHQVVFLRPALPIMASSVDPSYRPRFSASGTPKTEPDAPAGAVEQIVLTGTTVTRSFEVGNTGFAMLEYTAATPTSWLAVSPTDGGVAPGGKVRLDATINSTTLPLGPSVGSITVSDPNATNAPGLAGAVNVTVQEAAPLLFGNQAGPFMSQAAGSIHYFIIEVPEHLSEMSVRIRPGPAVSGDADLYVRYGEAPTTSAYDCRPFSSSSNETCTLTLPRAGTYYVMLRGFTAYNDVTLDVVAPGIPIWPIISNVQFISTSVLNLFWEDRAVNEGSYRLQRLLVGTGATWQPLATLPANSYYYADSTVVRDSTYRYRVRACNVSGCSPWTTSLNLTIPGPTIAVAPGSLSFLFLRGEDGSALVSSAPSASDPRAQFTSNGSVPSVAPAMAQDVTMAETANAIFYLSAQYEGIEWSAEATQPWLYPLPGHGTVNQDQATAIGVNVDATSLPVGVSSAAIVISDPNASNSPKSVPVTVDVRTVPVLLSGVTVSGLSGAAGSHQYYMVNVPPGAVRLTVRVFGETGTANVYLRQGAPPLTTKFDCAAVETCTASFPPAGVYYVMVHGSSSFTGANLVATLGGAPLPPSAPVTTVQTSSSAYLAWTDGSTNETHFATQQRAFVADTWGAWTNAGTPAANATNHTFTGLTAETGYQFRVRACNTDGCSSWATGAQVATPSAIPPTVPAPATATVISPTQITVSWADVMFETRYQVQRSTEVAGVFGAYANVDLPAANTTSLVDVVDPSSTHRYRVRACNTHGCSAYSITLAVSTPAGDPPPVPASLNAVAGSPTHINLSWPDVAGETHYQIYRRVRVDGVFGSYTLAGSVPADETATADYELNAGGTYGYRIRACNAFGCSAFRVSPTVTTPES